MMLSSIDDQWDEIEQILAERRELARIANIDREHIRGIIKLLETFNTASKLTESNNTDTLAYVWVGITQICTVCRVVADDPIYIKTVKARTLEYIESKFVLHQYHRVATFLHPNYKSLVFCSSREKDKAIRDAKNMLDQITTRLPNQPNQTQAPSSNSSRRTSTSSTDSESSFLSNYYSRSDGDLDEIDMYLNTRWTPDENVNVFDWWMERKSIYPNLCKLALKIHSIPASSLQSERTFSKSGLIISDRRTNLDPETVEDLVTLNKNFDFNVRLIILELSYLFLHHFINHIRILVFRILLCEIKGSHQENSEETKKRPTKNTETTIQMEE